MQFNLEVCKIDHSRLAFNAGLKISDLGKFGVCEVGFQRIVEVCETYEEANEVIDSVLNIERENQRFDAAEVESMSDATKRTLETNEAFGGEYKC